MKILYLKLSPEFVKGYFRKAEVFKEICLYDEAILNYGKALKVSRSNLLYDKSQVGHFRPLNLVK